ncbi:MAG: hypothetical protein WBO19_07075 [Terriglobia bacterium]
MGELAIVNPQRRVSCAALMPEYSFTPDRYQGVEIWAARVGASSRKRTNREERVNPARWDDTPLEYSTVGGITSQAALQCCRWTTCLDRAHHIECHVCATRPGTENWVEALHVGVVTCILPVGQKTKM